MPDIPDIWTSVTTTSAGSVRRCSRHCCAELTASTANPRLRRLSRRSRAVSSSSSTIRMVPFTARYLSTARGPRGREPGGSEEPPRARSHDRSTPRHEADEGQDERDNEDDFRDAGGAGGEAEEAEDRGDQSNDKECNRPGKHDLSSYGLC